MRSRREVATAQPLSLEDPRRIGPYELLARLGEGGMGTVYLGHAPEARDGGLVAVKVLRPELAGDEAFLARFRDEVANAARVASFCTAQVLDHGAADGRVFMVTEYIDGPSLKAQVAQDGPLSPGMLHGVAAGVAAALVAIHAAGLIHRDLKPGNVLLSMTGPRVIDFGIARALDATTGHTRTGEVMGSPGWIAPELILNGEVTEAADIFAWGCLLGYAGSGHHPFGQGTFQVMAARAVHAEAQIGTLPDPLAGLVRAALRKDPRERPTGQELLFALVGGAGAVSASLGETWRVPATMPPDGPAPSSLTGPTPAASPSPTVPPGAAGSAPGDMTQVAPAQRRRRALVAGGTALAMVTAVAGLVVLWPEDGHLVA